MPNEHNLLIVSDLHLAEGFVAEAGEGEYGHDAFLYDGAFARFLLYHEQMRRQAAQQEEALGRPWRLVLAGDVFDFWDMGRAPGDKEELDKAIEKQKESFKKQKEAFEKQKEAFEKQKEAFEKQKETSEEQKEAFEKQKEAFKELEGKNKEQIRVEEWLTRQLGYFKDTPSDPPANSYNDVRLELEKLQLTDGPQRRAFEELAWWAEVLLSKPGHKLSRRERRHGLGTTWQEVAWKLVRIYRGHREFFAALAWFIACGNDVVLIKGNHDLELHWPQIHNGLLPHLLYDAYRDVYDGQPIGPDFDAYPKELRAGLPTPEAFREMLPKYTPDGSVSCPVNSKLRFTFQEWFYYEKDLVYVEHGNQYEPIDSSVYFLAPKLPTELNKDKIELPWGALIARYFYNKIVAVHPFAQSMRPEERIIHWMINHDLLRILSIILATLPDILSALGRAIRQGLRGNWIWGDYSILALVPRFTYDLIQLLLPGMWKNDQALARDQARKLEQIAACYSQPSALPEQDDEAIPQANKCRRLAIPCLHGSLLGAAILLVMMGIHWLTGGSRPAWLLPLLAVGGGLTLVFGVWNISIAKRAGWRTLGQLCLQFGVVGLMAGLVADVFLASSLQWSSSLRWLVPLAALILAAVGGLLIKFTGQPGEAFIPKPPADGWLPLTIHSASSLFKELSLAGLIACVYLALQSREGMRPAPWLFAALTLFVLGLLAGSLYKHYSICRRPARQKDKWIRVSANWAVGLIVLFVLVGLIAAVPSSLPHNPTGGGMNDLVQFGELVYNFIVGPGPVRAMSLLTIALLALGVVILVETALVWGVNKLANRSQRQASQSKHNKRSYVAPDSAVGQLKAIEALARAEQRRLADNLLKILTLLLPLLSIILLVVFVAGLTVTSMSIANITSPNLSLGPKQLPLGLSLSTLAALAYWAVRQFSAATQHHDPASGYGDLFYRTAANIWDILENPSGGGLGRPRYLVFGHDHWADSKPIRPRNGQPTGVQQQWYVNAGTWLRGYVTEPQRHEVNENHSTFVQIIPGRQEDQTPRVLRWNDGANQPEPIVRRQEPESAGQHLWQGWEAHAPRVLLWTVLMAASWGVAAWQELDFMKGLWPVVWAAGWWLAISFGISLGNWIDAWIQYLFGFSLYNWAAAQIKNLRAKKQLP